MITTKKTHLVRAIPTCIVWIITLICIFPSSCYYKQPGPTPPKAVAGVLDLRSWNLTRDGRVLFGGEAEFYWRQYRAPEDLHALKPAGRPDYVRLPGPWEGQNYRGAPLPGEGFATYRMTVLLKETDQVLAIRMHEWTRAYRVYLNGKLAKTNGRLGTDLRTTAQAYTRGVVSFAPPSDGVLEIIIHAANFPDKMGAAEILLGRDDEIQSISVKKIVIDIFLFSSILFMGLYHLAIFFLRKKDRTPLYFGLYCLMIAYFTIYTGERYFFRIFPGADWDITYRLMHITFYLAVTLFGMFLHSLYPDEFRKPFARFLQVAGISFSLFVVVTPLGVYEKSIQFYYLITIAACVYALYSLTRALLHKRDGAFTFLACFIILFLSVIHDILTDLGIVPTDNIVPMGFFIFLFSQTYVLSLRFSRSFEAVEHLSDELQGKNLQLSNTWNYLNNVFNSLPSMLVSVNREGIITQWNTAAEKYTGIPGTQAVSKKFWDVVPYLKSYRGVFDRVIETYRPQERRRENIEDNGERKYINISINPLVYNGAHGAVIRVDDVTEMEKMDTQLRQAQRMETIGTLAGGLAHDFNNVLGGITGAVSLIKHELGKENMDTSTMVEMTGLLEESSRRAADVVNRLLTLSRKQDLSLTTVDLNATVKNVLKMCGNTFDKSIELKAVYHDRPATVRADPTQMEQVVLNICVNASHAMTIMRIEGERPGGTLTVSIERIHADRYFCKTHPEARPGYYWMLSHRDTGVGMDSKTISKVFDPFFSTKKTGKGTGLGLAMVYNIIQQHGGFVDVYSEPGVGSTFNVFLPELAGDTISAPAAIDEELARGTGLILIVDDEEIIRVTAAGMLEECGYDVMTASNGEEGIEVFSKHHHETAAVLLDVAMPRKSGIEAYEEMKKIDPSVKILLTSGFKQDDRVQKLLASGVDDFIQKPYSMVELSRKIRKVIG